MYDHKKKPHLMKAKPTGINNNNGVHIFKKMRSQGNDICINLATSFHNFKQMLFLITAKKTQKKRSRTTQQTRIYMNNKPIVDSKKGDKG